MPIELKLLIEPPFRKRSKVKQVIKRAIIKCLPLKSYNRFDDLKAQKSSSFLAFPNKCSLEIQCPGSFIGFLESKLPQFLVSPNAL